MYNICFIQLDEIDGLVEQLLTQKDITEAQTGIAETKKKTEPILKDFAKGRE